MWADEETVLDFLWNRITSRVNAVKYGIFKAQKYSWLGIGRKTKIDYGPLDDWKTEDYISLLLSFCISSDRIEFIFSRGNREDARAMVKFSSATELRDIVNNLKNNRDVARMIDLAIEFLVNHPADARNADIPTMDSLPQNLDNAGHTIQEIESIVSVCSYCGMEYSGEKRCRGCGASKWGSHKITLDHVKQNTTDSSNAQRETVIENIDWGKASGILKIIGEVTSSLSAIVRPKNEQAH